jgi:predicted nucleotidyltransferase
MNQLRELRISLNLSQVEAAKMLQISRRTYQNYEAKKDCLDKKYQYYLFQLHKLNTIDENHGILTMEYIKDTVAQVFKKYDVNFCYLFGSYAKKKATPTSDVDLLIDSPITGLNYFGLVEDLRRSLNKRIDLLKLDQLTNNLELIQEIMKDGIKIYG